MALEEGEGTNTKLPPDFQHFGNFIVYSCRVQNMHAKERELRISRF